MGVVKKINEALSQLEYFKMNKGAETVSVNIVEIPVEWENFNGTRDKWKRVIYEKELNINGCLYRPIEKDFLGHIHDFNDEIITNVTEGTSFTVYTPKWKKTVQYGESIFIPKGLKHLVDWHNENMLVNIIWHPSMGNGWIGKFEKEEE